MSLWLRWHDQRVRRATGEYLRNLRDANPFDHAEARSLERLAGLPDRVLLGATPAARRVEVPLDLLTNFSVTTGSQGSGKTMFILLLILAMLGAGKAFGLIDAKGELFERTLYLLSHFPHLWQRVVIIDFDNREAISPYNILAPQGDFDFFLTRRVETLKELLPGRDKLSLRGAGILRQCLAILAEPSRPLSDFERFITDDAFRYRLIRQSNNPEAKYYFQKIFPKESPATLAAVRARITALFSSEALKLSLGGSTAPNFQQLQDEGKIVLVNCAGPTLTRGVRLLLLALLLADIRQSIFTRRVRVPYVWFADEAHNFFRTPGQQEDIAEILNTGRSFGTFFHFITQHLETAIRNPEIRAILHQNLIWSLTLRSDPQDCSFLRRVLPVTGTAPKTVRPFQEQEFYRPEEERTILYEGIANLPNRTGYFFMKAHTPHAIQLRTPTLAFGEDFEEVVEEMKNTPEFGARIPRQQYLREHQEVTTSARDVFQRMEENYTDRDE